MCCLEEEESSGSGWLVPRDDFAKILRKPPLSSILHHHVNELNPTTCERKCFVGIRMRVEKQVTPGVSETLKFGQRLLICFCEVGSDR